MRNNAGKMVLTASNPAWNLSSRSPVGIAIDKGEPFEVAGIGLAASVLMLMDDERAAQLKRAMTLTWHFAWGDYDTDVAGLGAAFDATASCS